MLIGLGAPLGAPFDQVFLMKLNASRAADAEDLEATALLNTKESSASSTRHITARSIIRAR